ncbi:MAG TPA: response regulator [Burkholderiales bacterium]|jgi:CheY-like chemotaxis protein|nr:response regulator [Burkholderiales bacterium]
MNASRLQTRPLKGVPVLVVDDDPEVRDFLLALLSAAGAEVRAAASVADAVAVLAVWWPSVLLSDIGMPGQDGYALIRTVRALSYGRERRLAAAALTAHVQSEDRMRVLAAGYQAHVAKPADPDALIALVARLAQSATPELSRNG